MTAAAAMSERALQDAIVKLARLCGWLVYHTYDSRRSAPGFPDLVLVRGDTLMFVEVKTERGRVSAAQAEWHFALGEAGAVIHIWRPADWMSGVIDSALRPVW